MLYTFFFKFENKTKYAYQVFATIIFYSWLCGSVIDVLIINYVQ